MPKVTMIPATINPLTHLPSVAARKRRVAGYARVSTDSDEQFTSYEAQVDYYTKFIQSKPEWEFVTKNGSWLAFTPMTVFPALTPSAVKGSKK